MAITRDKKVEVLKDLEDKFSRAQAVYFAKYNGLSVKEAGDLRAKLREAGIDYVVAKKTLMKLAAKNQNLPELSDEVLEGPISAVFGYDDVVAPSKIIKNFDAKGEKVSLTGGILERELIDKAQALQLASLPSKLELIAKLVGTMKAPISGFHGALHGVMSKFVRTLDAYKATKTE
ncbi:50S ribosomal protein L10 [Candidatus Peregrinibacteria bacterium]|nr:50S ribosomal protein L10 [Candidatus Peregrinibacteria bacterium]